MRTSIRDLLDQVRTLQLCDEHTGRDPRVAHDARQSIGSAAAALIHLRQWRPDWAPEQPARRLSEALEAACAQVQAGNDLTQLARPAQLLAAAGDAVGALCDSATSGADRWAVTSAVAELVRRASSAYISHGPETGDPAVEAARAAALRIARAGHRLLPGAGRSMLDLPIPSPAGAIQDPLARAAAAAAEIDHMLARAAQDPRRPVVTVYELRSLAMAFQATLALVGAELGRPAGGAARAWSTVRQLARSLHDGARPSPDGPERLLRSAAQLHDGLLSHQAGGDSTRPAAGPVLQEIGIRTVSSAASLIQHVPALAGRVYLRADQFPLHEARIAERLRRQPIIARIADLTVLIDALRAAEHATAQITHAGSIGLGQYPMTNPAAPPPSVPTSSPMNAPAR